MNEEMKRIIGMIEYYMPKAIARLDYLSNPGTVFRSSTELLAKEAYEEVRDTWSYVKQLKEELEKDDLTELPKEADAE